jgi:hypothetical protein
MESWMNLIVGMNNNEGAKVYFVGTKEDHACANRAWKRKISVAQSKN